MFVDLIRQINTILRHTDVFSNEELELHWKSFLRYHALYVLPSENTAQIEKYKADSLQGMDEFLPYSIEQFKDLSELNPFWSQLEPLLQTLSDDILDMKHHTTEMDIESESSSVVSSEDENRSFSPFP